MSAAEKKVAVYMVGKSRGAKHGDRRMVTPEAAEKLVANGLARHPASKADEPESK